MLLCLRVDLDYVPWDADELGHGEPAMVLRLLDFSRSTGLKLHFFASNRSLHAFPAQADAVLGEGHHLDWLLAADLGAVSEAQNLFAALGVSLQGVGLKEPWPEGSKSGWPSSVQFVSSPHGCPSELRCFPVQSSLSGDSMRTWVEEAKSRMDEAADGDADLTLAFAPATLARLDPKLRLFQEVPNHARALGLPIRTLRDALKPSA